MQASCEKINGLSKKYFNDNKNYYLYSCFKNCSDKNFENDTYCIKIKAIRIIIIVIITIIVIIILSVFIRVKVFRYWRKHKFERDWERGKKDEKLMNDIMEDIMGNNK